jgi:hypothetical protein
VRLLFMAVFGLVRIVNVPVLVAHLASSRDVWGEGAGQSCWVLHLAVSVLFLVLNTVWFSQIVAKGMTVIKAALGRVSAEDTKTKYD